MVMSTSGRSKNIINVLKMAININSLPRNSNLANVYPTKLSKNKTDTVLKVATHREFRVQ